MFLRLVVSQMSNLYDFILKYFHPYFKISNFILLYIKNFHIFFTLYVYFDCLMQIFLNNFV